jgi:fucose 4-O-acetylase-like acetyltransferase
MNQNDFCKDCHLKCSCDGVEQQPDGSDCPHFILKIIAAFILPMIIFITSLAVFEKILSGENFWHNSEKLKTFVSFLMAMLTTAVFMLIVKLMSRLLRNFLRTFKI